jgi:hypothetical protein
MTQTKGDPHADPPLAASRQSQLFLSVNSPWSRLLDHAYKSRVGMNLGGRLSRVSCS